MEGVLMKFIHAADIHLDSPMLGLEKYDGAPVDEARGATRRALQNLVALAVEESVDFVLIAGDLYDGDWKDYNTGLFLVSQMAVLRENNIKAVIVAGNHDAASQITRNLRLPDNVRVLAANKPETFVLESEGVAVHGQGYSTRAVTENLAAAYPKADPDLLNIGVLHTCLEGREGHEPYAPCTLNDLMSRGYEYWALGHVHKKEIISESPPVVFSGNTQGRNIRETGAKGCMLVNADNGEIKGIEFKNLDVFRWSSLEIDISAAKDIDDVFEIAEKVIKKEAGAYSMPLAVRISLTGSSRLHGRILSREEHVKSGIRACAVDCGNGNIWVEKICFNTRDISARQAPLAGSDALRGLLDSISSLQYDEKALSEIAGEFADLFRKLPHEYLSDTEAIHPERKETLIRATEDVRHMLLSRILSSGGGR